MLIHVEEKEQEVEQYLGFLLAGSGRGGFGCFILFVLFPSTVVLNGAGRGNHPLSLLLLLLKQLLVEFVHIVSIPRWSP